MPDRPIVLTADEVRETLAGRMSHILRPITINPYDGAFYLLDGWPHRSKDGESPRIDGKDEPYPCPGAVGDRLWVRETWGVGSRPDPFTGCRNGVEYRADEELLQEGEALLLRSVEPPTGVDLDAIRPGWHSSTSMPRWASRLLLAVDSIRARRLHEITEDKAQQAGIPFHIDEELAKWETDGRQWHGPTIGVRYTKGPRKTPSTTHHFTALGALEDWWNHDQPTEQRWAKNPWIWDVTFKRVEQE